MLSLFKKIPIDEITNSISISKYFSIFAHELFPSVVCYFNFIINKIG
jgi:hypothetical protein